MADNEVKIQITADASDAEKDVRELKKEITEIPSTSSPKPAPAPAQSRSTSPAPSEPGRKGRYLLATEANPKQEAEDTTPRWKKLRKLTDDELAAQRGGGKTEASIQDRITQHHQSALAYEAKGMDQAAASARSEARKLEAEFKRSSKEQAAEEKAAAKERGREVQAAAQRWAATEKSANKEQAESQKTVTREIKEQEAMRRAGIRGVSHVVSAGQNIAAGGDVGATASSMLMSAGMRSGNPLVMIGSIVAAITAAAVATVAKERDKDTMQGLQFDTRRSNDAYQQNRARGVFGSSSSLVARALNADEEIASREAQRKEIAERARQKWYDPSSWTWGGLRKNAGQREQEINEQEIIAKQIQRASDLKQAQAKYQREEGGLELQALRGRSSRSLSGSRSAFVAEMGQEWLAKYKEVMQSSGSEAMAKEMADLTVNNSLRDRQVQAGAGLVDGRSGGAAIAAAARWATGSVPGQADVAAKIDQLHSTVQAGNQTASLTNQAK